MGRDSSEMDVEQIHEFVGRNGTGVLSLAASDTPYSAPVSYGYDATNNAFYFRLGFGEDSEKRRFIDSSAQARFLVYDTTNGGWGSVIAIGTLEAIDTEALTVDIARTLRDAELPVVDMWPIARDEIEFEIYRLDVETVRGRTTKGPA